jgi:Na+/H+ antiporter NhaD/arsenite permease-like protein
VTSVPELPAWAVALTGAGIVLILSRNRVRVARHVNWPILVLFAGLFVVVQGAVAGGVVATLEAGFAVPGPGHTATAIGVVTGSALLGSQVVSNIPWVALQIPVLQGLGYGASAPVVWMALAAGSTLAGNITFLGAASNLIVVDAARRRGISIHLVDFVKVGLPLTALTIVVLLGCLWLGI